MYTWPPLATPRTHNSSTPSTRDMHTKHTSSSGFCSTSNFSIYSVTHYPIHKHTTQRAASCWPCSHARIGPPTRSVFVMCNHPQVSLMPTPSEAHPASSTLGQHFFGLYNMSVACGTDTPTPCNALSFLFLSQFDNVESSRLLPR